MAVPVVQAAVVAKKTPQDLRNQEVLVIPLIHPHLRVIMVGLDSETITTLLVGVVVLVL
jgi:hypothetical protein